MKIFRKILLPLLLLTILDGLASLSAQPIRGRVLSDLVITSQPDQVDVRIEFNFPVRYVRHFPASEGDELQIQLEPIAMNPSDRDSLVKREAISAEDGNLAGVSEVVFDGDAVIGLRVTVYFLHKQSYTVAQGSDYRSILVTTRTPEKEK